MQGFLNFIWGCLLNRLLDLYPRDLILGLEKGLENFSFNKHST